MKEMSKFFVNVLTDAKAEDVDMGCFSCDGSCHCECYGGSECNTTYP